MPMNLKNTAALRSNAGAVEEATDNPGEERQLTEEQRCNAAHPERVQLRCQRPLGHAGEHTYWLAW